MPSPAAAAASDVRRRRFRRLVLRWYAGQARSLPWRTAPNPYRVLVSEFMLQQTQVSRVVPVYEAFVERFPTVEALAAAPRSQVLCHWRGLGYNRRAVRLHESARAILDRHGGSVPDDLDALLALPGVGGYTARAVLAFGFGQATAPVDTNVARVLTRAVAGRPLARRGSQELADEILPEGQGLRWSQALMDLGALHCTTRAPRCEGCPVSPACTWRLEAGAQDPAVATVTRSRPQPGFAGSDRFHRGRLVDALRDGPVSADRLCASAQLDDIGRLDGLVAGLVADGLAQWRDGALALPP